MSFYEESKTILKAKGFEEGHLPYLLIKGRAQVLLLGDWAEVYVNDRAVLMILHYRVGYC